VLDQLEAGDRTARIDADENVDRLAGIADGVGEIGIQVDVAEQAIAGIGRRNRRIALRQTETVGVLEEGGGLGAAKEFAQPPGGFGDITDENSERDEGEQGHVAQARSQRPCGHARKQLPCPARQAHLAIQRYAP